MKNRDLEVEMTEHLPEEDIVEGETIELHEQLVRDRAWQISQRPDAGTPEENWRRAQGELLQEHRADAA